jgi:hypothetical protein
VGHTLEDQKDKSLMPSRSRSSIRKEIEVNLESQISDTFREMISSSGQATDAVSQQKKMKTVRQSFGMEMMSQQHEWSILQKLDRTGCVLPHEVARLRRKLHLRRVSFFRTVHLCLKLVLNATFFFKS